MKQHLRDALPRWLLTWLVCVALDAALAELLHTDGRWWLAAAALLLWCALLAAAERFGRIWAMLALLAVALGLCLLLSDRQLLFEAAANVLLRAGTANGYCALVLLLLCAAAALPLSSLLRFYWMRAALSIGTFALWLAAALLQWPFPRQIPAAMLPLLLLTLAETSRRSRREEEPRAALKRALLLSLLPTALLLALLPAPAEPYGYPLLHSAAEKVEQLWHDAGTALRYRRKGGGEFSLSFNGISDEAEMGERNEGSGLSVVYARPAREPDGPVYLFGNSWDRFDGRGWKSSLTPGDAEYLNWSMDSAEHLYAFWRLMKDEGGAAQFSDYFRANSVYLVCRDLNVRTMFSVMNTTRIYTDDRRFPYNDAPTGILFDYVQRDEVWYRIYFLESNPRMRGALIAASEGTEYGTGSRVAIWRRVSKELGHSFRLNLIDDADLEVLFSRRAALIRRVYLDSSSVSERARALAGEITADCRSDSEKAAAIGAYLRKHYTYTLSPAPVPEGEDLLDWLLFESKEGYCSWYASAAVLLSRSVGVPARYVQGYRGFMAEDEFTPLVSGDAHAWCECYIAGYGWMTVEATPGFDEGGEGWLTAEEARELGIDTAGTAAGTEEADPADGTGNSDAPVPLTPAPDEPAPVSEEPQAPPMRFGRLLILIPVVPIAVLLTVLLLRRARRKRRYAEADPAERLQMDLEQLLRDLRGKGYPRRPEESLRQYFDRLPWHYLLTRPEEAAEIAALYDRTFFSPAAPSEGELALHRAFAARFRPRTLRQWLLWLSLQ
ncbi:MAG: transglutaminase domain-containing protein [Oscillospiraceae bacterium]|nr:transglutaminase domain-containing protein [Oscillospiraceae bacterium]